MFGSIDSTPTVLMTAYPVRGLDINSSYTIYGLLNQQKMKGVAVLLVGEDRSTWSTAVSTFITAATSSGSSSPARTPTSAT